MSWQQKKSWHARYICDPLYSSLRPESETHCLVAAQYLCNKQIMPKRFHVTLMILLATARECSSFCRQLGSLPQAPSVCVAATPESLRGGSTGSISSELDASLTAIRAGAEANRRRFKVSPPRTARGQVEMAARAVERAAKDGIVRQTVRFALASKLDESLGSRASFDGRGCEEGWPGGPEQIYGAAARPLTEALLKALLKLC